MGRYQAGSRTRHDADIGTNPSFGGEVTADQHGERGRTAIMGKHAQYLCELAMLGSTATELGRIPAAMAGSPIMEICIAHTSSRDTSH